MTVKQKHLFYTELTKLLGAGFGIRQAAEVMLDTRLPAVQAEHLRAMTCGLDQGKSIAEAFSAGLSPMEAALLSAGERGGKLADGFRHLADYFGLLATVRAEALRRLIYPLVLIHLGVVVWVVTGTMRGTYGMDGVPLRVLGGWLCLDAALVALGLSGWWTLRVAARLPGVSRVVSVIPFAGRVRRDMAMARFTKAWHVGLLAALPMHKTALMAGEAAATAELAAAGCSLAAAARRGELLGPVMAATSGVPAPFARSYATAEASGTLDDDLARWSAHYQAESARSCAALGTAITTAVYFTALLLVAWCVWNFYAGYYGRLDEMMEE
jgi:type II secretory pathway component PulF